MMMQQIKQDKEKNTRKNKLLTGVLIMLILVLVIMLIGLFFLLKQGDFKHLGFHTWKEATCTEPETCKKCGMTKGKKEGHEWIEATCTEPKTCEECGKTKGEAEGHLWAETEAGTSVCEMCGMEEAVVEAAVEAPAEEATATGEVASEEAVPTEEAAPAEVKGNMTLSESDIMLFEAASLYFFEDKREDSYFSISQLTGELQNNKKSRLLNYFYMFGGKDEYDAYQYFDDEYCQKYVIYGAFEDAKQIYKELFYVDLWTSDFVQDAKESAYDTMVLYSSDYDELVWSIGSDGFFPWVKYQSCTYDITTDLYQVIINNYSIGFDGQACFYLKESKNNSFGFEIVGADWKMPEEALVNFLFGASEEYVENGVRYGRDIEVPAYWENGSEIYYKDLLAQAKELWGETADFWQENIWLDFDNDGELELYLSWCDYYGGMIFDARGGNAYVLACGEGTAGMLSYTYWQEKYWIVHRDTSHQGRQMYWLTEYSGSNIVNEISLTAEYWESDRYDENSDFSFAGEKISMEEFERLRMEMFGY